MEFFIILAGAVALGLIPANIAQKKGYDFTTWWIYGALLFIVAIIHVMIIEDKNGNAKKTILVQSTADELIKYKELLDQGVLTPEEFQTKKEQLLKLK